MSRSRRTVEVWAAVYGGRLYAGAAVMEIEATGCHRVRTPNVAGPVLCNVYGALEHRCQALRAALEGAAP